MTLDDLIALCDEMSALARAGVPLDRGLRAISRELPGKLGRMTDKMAAGLERGEDLATFLRAHERDFPPAFVAVVESGLRVGRLPAALEDLASSSRRLASFKRSLLAAWLYPLLVIVVAFQLLLFMLAKPVPVMVQAYQDVAKHPNPLLDVVKALSATADWWGWILPLLLAAYLVWTWVGLQSPRLMNQSWSRWIPGLAGPVIRLKQSMQLANFTHLLSLLVEHLVPLPEALRLAAEGDVGCTLKNSARQLSEKLERGETSSKQLTGAPPMLNWLLTNPPPANELGPALRLLAEGYAADVDRATDHLNWYGPVVLTALVGGTVVSVYSVLAAGPWISVLYAYIEQALS